MDIWFIDAENVGCGLLDELPVKGISQQRFLVFSRSSTAAKWAARYPLHARLFNDYEVGKNQADFYMVSVLAQALNTEPQHTKRVILLTKDQDLIQAFKNLCTRHQTELMLLVSEQSNHLPGPEVADGFSVNAESLLALSGQTLPTASLRPNVITSQTQTKKAVTKPTIKANGSKKKTPKASSNKPKTLNGSELNKKQKQLLQLINKNPLKMQEIQEQLNLSFEQTQKVTNPLIQKNKMVRVSKSSGRWISAS